MAEPNDPAAPVPAPGSVEPGPIQVTANGGRHAVAEGLSLERFLADLGLAVERVVVERNGCALTPSEARATTLADGDRLEVVRIVAGG